MGTPRSKSEYLTETAKSFVEELYIFHRWHRDKEVVNRYINKGLAVEEDSITLFCKYAKQFFVKNEEIFYNDYLSGTPDLLLKCGEVITEIVDVKSSWDIFTFMRSKRELNEQYYWQVQGYMALTGASNAKVVYCLIDTPEVIINDEKRRLMWKMGVISDENEEYKKAVNELEKNLTYPDIPESERIMIWEVGRNDEDISKIYEKVELARKYFNELQHGSDTVQLQTAGSVR